MCVHTHTLTHTHACTHMRTHTCTHAHTHFRRVTPWLHLRQNSLVLTPCSLQVSQKVIVLLRHGDYKEWAAQELKGLTPCGQRQASRTAKAIKHLSGLPRITKVISSTMPRAKETAVIIQSQLPEGPPIDFDQQLEEGSPDHAHTRERFNRVYHAHFVQGSTTTTILVTHANLIRYLLCR